MSATGTTDQPTVGLRPAARPRQHSEESIMPGATRAQRLSGERARLLPRPARWLVDHRLGPAAAGPSGRAIRCTGARSCGTVG